MNIRRILKRIIRNAALAGALNLLTAVLIELRIGFSIKNIINFLLFWPCLLNVFILVLAGFVMALREERLIRQGKLVPKEQPGYKERLRQIVGEKGLPQNASEYIEQVVKKVRYRFKVRCEVAEELGDHFIDGLAECENEQQRQERAERLIGEFGDAGRLAALIRRGKKRCRPLWEKAIIRSVQATGVIILLFGLYTCWFVSGGAVIRIDYLAKCNQLCGADEPKKKVRNECF